ncbi:hypothetical protein AAHE18_03G322500 [Arachis hypogaea]
MVGNNHSQRERERNRDWIKVLMNSNGHCDDHPDLRSKEKNFFCVDCAVRMCKNCKEAHSLHRRFQIYKYSYQDVFRHSELQKYFDCSKIQTYISNNERIVHLKPRPSTNKPKTSDLSPDSKFKEYNFSSRTKPGGTCEECGKHLQDERNRFCSITCKCFPWKLKTKITINVHGGVQRNLLVKVVGSSTLQNQKVVILL